VLAELKCVSFAYSTNSDGEYIKNYVTLQKLKEAEMQFINALGVTTTNKAQTMGFIVLL